MSFSEKDLIDFISLPEKYDFVEDTLPSEEVKKKYRLISDPYERYFMYHAVAAGLHNLKSHIADYLVKEPVEYSDNIHNFFMRAKELGIRDPDCASNLLQNIYRELWPELTQKDFMWSSESGWLASDTMTSAQTSLNVAMKAFSGEGNLKKLYSNGKIFSSRNCSVALAANNANTHFYEMLEEKYPHLKNFISAYHTLGNYCLVPEGFNSPRSGFGTTGRRGAVYDYWDLTLGKINEWYLSHEDDAVRNNLIQKELLHGKGNPNNCIKWLHSFGEGEDGWKNFVNTLYFQDYVEDYDNGDYRPKPFWEGHDWKNSKLPQEKCDDFFNEVSDRIQKRGRKLLLALWEKNLIC